MPWQITLVLELTRMLIYIFCEGVEGIAEGDWGQGFRTLMGQFEITSFFGRVVFAAMD